jgi:hypothetical protein
MFNQMILPGWYNPNNLDFQDMSHDDQEMSEERIREEHVIPSEEKLD